MYWNYEWLQMVTKKLLPLIRVLFVISILLAAIGYRGEINISSTDTSLSIKSSVQLGSEDKNPSENHNLPLSKLKFYRAHLKQGETFVFSSLNEAAIYRNPKVDADNERASIHGDVATVIIQAQFEQDLWFRGDVDPLYTLNYRLDQGFFTKEEALQTGLRQMRDLAKTRPFDSTCNLNSLITRSAGARLVYCIEAHKLFQNLD